VSKEEMSIDSQTYSALHLTRPHAVELVVRQFGRSLGELGDGLNDMVDGLLGSLEQFGDCFV
jgi:hypothetical protein